VRAPDQCLHVAQDVNNVLTTGFDSTLFEGELKRFCDVLAPVAKGIKCLESSHSTPADVYLFFLAVSASYHEFLQSGAQGLDVADQEAIRRSINYRFKQLIDDNSYDIYFASFMIDASACLSFAFIDPQH
jgi:hypothetical protein